LRRIPVEPGTPISCAFYAGFSDVCTQDYILAYTWLSLAIAQPNADAQLDADAQTARNEIAAKMTPAQIAEAQRLAQEWRPKSNPPR
jgi:hypothetical protein